MTARSTPSTSTACWPPSSACGPAPARALVSLVDDRGVVPIVILDDAQGPRDDLLLELHGLTSLDFDGREYLTICLVGHPLLARRLRRRLHAALAQRVVIYAPPLAKTDPLLFDAMLDHSLAAAASAGLIPADARSLIQRVTRGLGPITACDPRPRI